MKRVFVVCILFFLLPSVMLFPQNKQNEPQQKNSKKAKIAVFRPTNLEEQSRFDGVCIAIEETIALNLKLIGSYEIIEPSMAAPETEDALLAYMQENAVDNAVYGDLFIDDSGAIAVEISVFDRKEKGVTSTEKVSAGSYFDIFDTSEELVTKLLGTFSDRHIAYGRLKLSSNSDFGSYTVTLNGQEVGSNVDEIPRLLTGSYTLIIRQPRVVGEVTVTEQRIQIEKGKATTVSFTLPLLTDEERSLFMRLDTEIMRWWGVDVEKLEERLQEALRLCRAGGNLESVGPGDNKQESAEFVLISPAIHRLEEKYTELLGIVHSEHSGADNRRHAPVHPEEMETVIGKHLQQSFSDFNRSYTSLTTTYPIAVINRVLPKSLDELAKKRRWARFETQTAGGTLGVLGLNLAMANHHIQLSILAGAGYSNQVLGAAVARLTWALFDTRFTPTLSAYSTLLTNTAEHAVNAGPSLGFELRFNDGNSALYIENNFTVNIIPMETESFTYLPSVGVKF